MHSELGFLDCDYDNHGTHDYCEIVKTTNTQARALKEFHVTIEIVKIVCVHCSDLVETHVFQNCFNNSQNHLIARQSTHITLFNRSLLI